MTEFILSSGISRLNISLDAAIPETYSAIRGGDLNSIEAKINYFLDQRGPDSLPLVRVSFVRQDENKDEELLFIKKWRNKVDSVEIQKLHDFSQLADLEMITTSSDLNRTLVYKDNAYCYSPFSYVAIWSNGQISPCCSFHGSKLSFGNILSGDTISSVWNGVSMQDLRRQFKDDSLNAVCNNCISCTV
jgi:radical SAM protein with 4Fe4S-binding SPASM domain